jgi:hypothetical protein
MKKSHLFQVILYASIVIVSFFVCSEASQKAKITISEKIISVENIKNQKVSFLGIFDSTDPIPPAGYKIAAIGNFETKALTIRCNIEMIKKLSIDICKKENYNSFIFTEFKEPTIFNTCYKCKVVFLVALY